MTRVFLVRMVERWVLVMVMSLVLISVGAIRAHAALGDLLDSFIPSISGSGRGVAFDPATGDVYYTLRDSTDIFITDANNTPATTISPGIRFGALSWDAKRGVLWGGGYQFGELGNIYQITPAGVKTFQFHFMPTGGNCYSGTPGFIDGLAYDEGASSADSDDSLWISDDAGFLLHHVDLSGNLIASFPVPPNPRSGNPGCNTGIAAGGAFLWLGLQSGPDQQPHDIVSVAKSDPTTVLISFPFSNSNVPGPEDLALDFVTIPGTAALWSNQFGTPNVLKLWDIPGEFLLAVEQVGEFFEPFTGLVEDLIVVPEPEEPLIFDQIESLNEEAREVLPIETVELVLRDLAFLGEISCLALVELNAPGAGLEVICLLWSPEVAQVLITDPIFDLLESIEVNPVFQVFDFSFSYIIPAPIEDVLEIFGPGDLLSSNFPFFGFQPSYSTIEVENVISNGDLTTLELRVEGLSMISESFADFTIEGARVQLHRRVDRDRFEVRGFLGLGGTSDGINVLLEDVSVAFGGLRQTIPAGSFRRHADRGVRFDGEVGGVTRISIRDDGEFLVKGSGLGLSGIDLSEPVDFSLQIGNDLGATEIQFDNKGHFQP